MLKNSNKKRKQIRRVEEQEEIVYIKSYNHLRLQRKRKVNLDLSELPKSTDNKDIQGLNLENLNLDINLRKIWIPYDRESVYINYDAPKDVFIHLNHANLKGNYVVGNLSPIHGKDSNGNNLGIAYYWYNEDTFDEIYKENYPEYFLDANAPQELKDKFYNPKLKVKESVLKKLSEKELEKDNFLERQTLTFKEYCKYYNYLKGKYLGNFKIDEVEKVKMAFLDYFGLEGAKKQLEKLSAIDLSIEELLRKLYKIEVTNWMQWLEKLSSSYLNKKKETTRTRKIKI